MLVCISTHPRVKLKGGVLKGNSFEWNATGWGVQDADVLLGHDNKYGPKTGNIEVDPMEILDKHPKDVNYTANGSEQTALVQNLEVSYQPLSGNIEVDPAEILDKHPKEITFAGGGADYFALTQPVAVYWRINTSNIEVDRAEILDKYPKVLNFQGGGADYFALTQPMPYVWAPATGNIEVDVTELLDKITTVKTFSAIGPDNGAMVQSESVMFSAAGGNIESDSSEILDKYADGHLQVSVGTSVSTVLVDPIGTYMMQTSDGAGTGNGAAVTQAELFFSPSGGNIEVDTQEIICKSFNAIEPYTNAATTSTVLVDPNGGAFTATAQGKVTFDSNMMLDFKGNNIGFGAIGMTGEPRNPYPDKFVFTFEAGPATGSNLPPINEGRSFATVTRLSGGRVRNVPHSGVFSYSGTFKIEDMIDNNFGAQDFGFEFWLYNSGWANGPNVFRSSGGWEFTFSGSSYAAPNAQGNMVNGGAGFYVDRLVTRNQFNQVNGGRIAIGSTPYSGSSSHYAVNRVGGTIYTHKDGALVTSWNIGEGVSIEADPNSPSSITYLGAGFLDDLWIRIGAPIRSQANFNPRLEAPNRIS